MADNYVEQLFEAIDIITQKKLENLPYDQTIVCTIVSNENAENNEYIVTDGTTTFNAYSENTTYRKNAKVYVTIPNNDMLNKKQITGLYIEGGNGSLDTYISPMNNFIDLTDDVTEGKIVQQYSLLANNPERKSIVLWDSGNVEWLHYNCLGILASFMSLFNSLNVTSGHYGLSIIINYQRSRLSIDSLGLTVEEILPNTHTRVLYMDTADMFGNPYNFTTSFQLEKIFNLSNIAKIINMKVTFFLSRDFLMDGNIDVPYKDDLGNNLPDNLFVSNISIKLGDLLTNYTDDTVKLFCNLSLKYSIDKLPRDRKLYLRWIHKTDNGLLVLDLNEDMLNDESLYIDMPNNTAAANFDVHWYHYVLSDDTPVDPLAGNFWVPMTNNGEPWEKTVVPSNNVLNDYYKVIIEYPSSKVLFENILYKEDEDFVELWEDVEPILTLVGVSESNFFTRIRKYLYNLDDTDTLSVDDFASEKEYQELKEKLTGIVTSPYNYYCQDISVPMLYQNNNILELDNYLASVKSQIHYYESNEICFTNEKLVTLETVDLVLGLTLSVDTTNGGGRGIYRLYDERNEIINTNEAQRLRTITASYKSISLGINGLDLAAEIIWCIPLSNSMILAPLDEYEYSLENGDIYFEVTADDALADEEHTSNRIDKLDVEHPGWRDYMDFTPALLYQLMLDKILLLNTTDVQYQEKLKAIKDLFLLLIEQKIISMYQELLQTVTENAMYAIIYRFGQEQGAELKGALLINVELLFRIKEYYIDTYTNNRIFCLIRKNDRVYMTDTSLHFASLGNSGTEATFYLTMHDANGFEVKAIIPGKKVIIQPHLYDYNNDAVDISYIDYEWYSEPDLIEIDTDVFVEPLKFTMLGTNLILTADLDMKVSDGAHAILQAETEFTLVDAEHSTERVVTLTTYLPIAVKANSLLTHINGTTSIIYDSNGTNPAYYKDPYELFTRLSTDAAENINWELIGTDDELEDATLSLYYPSLSVMDEIVATNMYYTNIKPISVLAYTYEGEINPIYKELWCQPILIYQNRYGSAMMNNWDGTLQTDEGQGTILASMVGAGIKNDDNSFSGVLMGNVALADERIGNKNGMGLYGFHHGELSFGLNVDGTAFFGKSGSGRIVFDGNSGVIQSAAYTEPHTNLVPLTREVVDPETGEITEEPVTMLVQDPATGEMIDQEVTTTEVISGVGMLIDLDDSTLKAYGKAGAVEINTNEYGAPLFVIRDSNYDTNPEGNTLFFVSSEAYDPITNEDVAAKYFLQSSNYTNVDPDVNDEDDPTGSYMTGALFDLESGRLDIHGKAGRVSVHGDNSNALFQIRGWKRDEETLNFYKNILMNVAPNNYYLLSLDYKANHSGFKFDINNGKILAASFNLKAGDLTNGTILISSSGTPYLSITTGTDYIEEIYTEDNQLYVNYCSYDAIDLADADALFEPGRYAVRNEYESGYHYIEEYEDELYTYTGNEPEYQKMLYYYEPENPGEEMKDSNMIRIDKMYPPETLSFEEYLTNPNATKIYEVSPELYVLDTSYYYDEDKQYYALEDGQYVPVELLDNREYHLFENLKSGGNLYYWLGFAIEDTGEGYKLERLYAYCTNPEEPNKLLRTCIPFADFRDSSYKYIPFEANKFYYKNASTGSWLRAIQSSVKGNGDAFYLPYNAEEIGALTYDEVRGLSDEYFYKVDRQVIDITEETEFYDIAYAKYNQAPNELPRLYYYYYTWVKVEPDDEFVSGLQYGLKLDYSDPEIIDDVIDDDTYYYVENKWYYLREEVEYRLAKEYDESTLYYYLDYDEYVECPVVEKTGTILTLGNNTEQVRIFEENKYCRYIAYKQFLYADEYDDNETYYNLDVENKTRDERLAELNALNLEDENVLTSLVNYEIKLCDINQYPYATIRASGFTKTLQTNGGTNTSFNGLLYRLLSNGYSKIESNTPYSAYSDYYIRYNYSSSNLYDEENGADNPFELSANGNSDKIRSVKLVNITKDKFELKSHNWVSGHSGMHLYINANQNVSIAAMPILLLDNYVTLLDNTISSYTITTGGGYIEGYGYYGTITLDLHGLETGYEEHFPKFILDWRAGINHYPINVDNKFKVSWNGRVDADDLYATKGMIGTWYIDDEGIYSFKPGSSKVIMGEASNFTNRGVALFSNNATFDFDFNGVDLRNDPNRDAKSISIMVGSISGIVTTNNTITFNTNTYSSGYTPTNGGSQQVPIYATVEPGHTLESDKANVRVIGTELFVDIGNEGDYSVADYNATGTATIIYNDDSNIQYTIGTNTSSGFFIGYGYEISIGAGSGSMTSSTTEVNITYTSVNKSTFIVLRDGKMYSYNGTLKYATLDDAVLNNALIQNDTKILNSSIYNCNFHGGTATGLAISNSTISKSYLENVTIGSSSGIVTNALYCTGNIGADGTLYVPNIVCDNLIATNISNSYMATYKIRVIGKFITTRKKMRSFLHVSADW